MKLQFVLGKGLSSRAIAWFSAGHFSHVDYVMANGYLAGARANQIRGCPAGVQIRPPWYEPWKERTVVQLNVDAAKEAKFWEFLKSQLDKPYDSTAIWGFMTGRDWRQADSWFCSELIAAGLEAAGIMPILYTPKNKLTPAGLATVVSALGGRILSADFS